MLETIEMIRYLKFDIRAATLSLMDCVDPDPLKMMDKVEKKLRSILPKFASVVDEVVERYQIPIVNKKLSITPLSALVEPHASTDLDRAKELLLDVSSLIDSLARESRVDYVGGLSAYVARGHPRR